MDHPSTNPLTENEQKYQRFLADPLAVNLHAPRIATLPPVFIDRRYEEEVSAPEQVRRYRAVRSHADVEQAEIGQIG